MPHTIISKSTDDGALLIPILHRAVGLGYLRRPAEREKVMKIGCMIWRIGDILDFNEQIEWVKAHGFEAVEFWTLPGSSGVWQGFDIKNASPENIAQLKRILDGFEEVDIHAGFNEMGLRLGGKEIIRMEPTFELAAEIGAQVITVHPEPKTDRTSEAESLERLNDLAGKYGVCVGLETMGGLATLQNVLLVKRLALPHVGITLDVGHLYFENGAAFENYGTLGNLIDEVSVKIIHVHAHDYDGRHDHLAIGHGFIDFPDIIGALYRAHFLGSICLEINPDREPPADILKTQKQLREIIISVHYCTVK